MSDRQAFLDAEREKWLSIDEAAYVLSTSHRAIVRMMHKGLLPHRREGKIARIHIDDLRPPKEVSHGLIPDLSRESLHRQAG